MPEIIVWEAPRPQQRHRTAAGHEYTPAETKEAQHRIREAWRKAGHGRQEGPLELIVWAYFTRPKDHFGTGRNAGTVKDSAPKAPMGSKNDWDNLGKLVGDALNGIAYADDGAIVDGHVHKRYSPTAAWVIQIKASAIRAAPERPSREVELEAALMGWHRPKTSSGEPCRCVGCEDISRTRGDYASMERQAAREGR